MTSGSGSVFTARDPLVAPAPPGPIRRARMACQNGFIIADCLELKNCSTAKNDAINKKLTRKPHTTPLSPRVRTIESVTHAFIRAEACCTYRPSVAFEGQDRAAPQPSARRTAPPTPRPVALDSAPQPTTRPPTQESSPTSRPTEPSATPDDPLGLPEDSATAAPAADGTLGRRLAWAAAACALAALLL